MKVIWMVVFPVCTAWKVSKYGVFAVLVIFYSRLKIARIFPGLYLPVFGLNTEIYGVIVLIQSEYGKMRTRKNSVFWTLFMQWWATEKTPRSFFTAWRYWKLNFWSTPKSVMLLILILLCISSVYEFMRWLYTL